MKSKLLIVTLVFIVIAACNKNQFTTKPQLTYKGESTQVVGPGGSIIFTLHYTDKEGDIQNYLYLEKKTSDCPADSIVTKYAIPSNVPPQKNGEGDIIVSLSYLPGDPYPGIGQPTCGRSDTCIFRFALADKANNTSDTISSPQIIITK